MSVSLIGQGYSPTIGSSVAVELMRLFQDTAYNSFTGIVAFASRDAVSALSPYISTARTQGWEVKIVVGIDQGGTSKQALDEIETLGVRSYIYHINHPGNSVIFHPKIYLFEGADKYAAIIGSNNLTTNGLVRNAECATLIRGSKEDSFYTQLYSYWAGLFNLSDTALRPITRAFIDELSEHGLVPNEKVRSNRHDSAAHDSEASPLSAPFEVGRVQRLPQGFSPKSRRHPQTPVESSTLDYSADTDYEVLIAEIPRSGDRWKQVNVKESIFREYFGATSVEENDRTIFYGNLNFYNINSSGFRQAVEHRQAVYSSTSHNYRFELSCPETNLPYPNDGRPIGVYIKKGEEDFDYIVMMPNNPLFSDVRDYLHRESAETRSDRMKNIYISFSTLRDTFPSLPFFIDR